MSFNNQTTNSLYSSNAGISHVTQGAYLSATAPSASTLVGPNGFFKLGDWFLTTAGALYYLQSVATVNGVTSATWTLIQTSGGGGGVLPVPSGGTGDATLTAHGVLLGEGTSPIVASSAGTSGQAFVSGGASADGAYGVAGVNGGGTGVATLTGLALGSGTSNFTGVTYTPVTAWTPNLQINGSSTGITYSPAPTGFYQQIGSMVYFNANINLSSKGASTGNVTISNLPISSGPNGLDNFVSIIPASVTFSTTNTTLYGVCGTSSTVLSLNQTGTGLTPGPLVNTNLANNSSLLITGFYFIN